MLFGIEVLVVVLDTAFDVVLADEEAEVFSHGAVLGQLIAARTLSYVPALLLADFYEYCFQH